MLRTCVDVLHTTAENPELTPRRLITADMIDRMLRHTYHSYRHVESGNVFDGLRAYQAQHQRESTMVAIMSCSYQQGGYETRSYFPDMPFENQPLFIY